MLCFFIHCTINLFMPIQAVKLEMKDSIPNVSIKKSGSDIGKKKI